MANEVNGKFWAVDAAGNLYIVNPVTLKSNIADLSVTTQSEDGLLSAADKVKYDALVDRVTKLESLLDYIVGVDSTGAYIQKGE